MPSLYDSSIEILNTSNVKHEPLLRSTRLIDNIPVILVTCTVVEICIVINKSHSTVNKYISRYTRNLLSEDRGDKEASLVRPLSYAALCWSAAVPDWSSPSVCFSVGVLIAYAANHNVTNQIKSTRRFINTNLRDLKTFANNTPAVRSDTRVPGASKWTLCSHYLLFCCSKSNTWRLSTPQPRTKSCRTWTVSWTNSHCLHYRSHLLALCPKTLWTLCADIGPLLGGRIHSQLEKEVVPTLDVALRMAGGNISLRLALNTNNRGAM